MTSPRNIAFGVLRAVDERDVYVNLLLPTLLREAGLDSRDAALATELTHGTIRRQGTYDAIITSLANRDLDPAVRDALRLGAHQLLSMRIPAHAAVSTTVSLVRHEIGHRPAGFVNAILRRIAEKPLDEWLDVVTTGLGVDEALAIRESHPLWIVKELKSSLRQIDATDELPDLLVANNDPAKVTLVARPGLSTVDELPGTPGRLSPYSVIMDGGDPGAIAPVRQGRAGVQDEGSQLVALTLADAAVTGPETAWLDLCAGPGGKAALLSAVASQRGITVTANEPQAHRAELVRQSVRALSNVEVVEHDAREGPWKSGSFDRVLLDAPCSGLGALRRRPESRWRRSRSDIADLVELQSALLRRAVEVTRPGGIIGYATCSPVPEETIQIVETVGPRIATLESVHQWWPHRDGTDAMFIAILRRR